MLAPQDEDLDVPNPLRRERAERLMMHSIQTSCLYNILALYSIHYRDEPELDEEDGLPLLRRDTPLHLAARLERPPRTIDLLFWIYSADYVNESGLRHFHVACRYGFGHHVERFLAEGQDPNCLGPGDQSPALRRGPRGDGRAAAGTGRPAQRDQRRWTDAAGAGRGESPSVRRGRAPGARRHRSRGPGLPHRGLLPQRGTVRAGRIPKHVQSAEAHRGRGGDERVRAEPKRRPRDRASLRAQRSAGRVGASRIRTDGADRAGSDTEPAAHASERARHAGRRVETGGGGGMLPELGPGVRRRVRARRVRGLAHYARLRRRGEVAVPALDGGRLPRGLSRAASVADLPRDLQESLERGSVARARSGEAVNQLRSRSRGNNDCIKMRFWSDLRPGHTDGDRGQHHRRLRHEGQLQSALQLHGADQSLRAISKEIDSKIDDVHVSIRPVQDAGGLGARQAGQGLPAALHLRAGGNAPARSPILDPRPARSRTVHLIFGLGTPLQLEREATIVGAFAKFIYNLPIDASNYTRPFSDQQQQQQPKTRSRWALYRALGQLLELRGLPEGRACVLRSICEAAHGPFARTAGGLLQPLLQTLLTPSSTINEPYDVHEDRDYVEAEALGRGQAAAAAAAQEAAVAATATAADARCHALYPRCPVSILDAFTAVVAQKPERRRRRHGPTASDDDLNGNNNNNNNSSSSSNNDSNVDYASSSSSSPPGDTIATDAATTTIPFLEF
ncbi:unnamed protein product [Trichogramma brassicae]|uniref:ANK_REP_REGION domain-containing protein n=1 Tax=Trichogramma brassicae TaxID=86971 RepID=A0A6H5IR57_9HYME|nr:unnamed protein product [Trichogramma brassicae]